MKRGVGIALGAVALIGGVGALGVVGVVALIGTFRVDPVGFDEVIGTPAPPVTSASPAAAQVDDAWIADRALATGIPERAMRAYANADSWARETLGCAIGWNTLAGIGWVESHHGELRGGSVDADGVTRPAITGIPLDGTNDTMAIPDTDGGELDGDATWDRAVGPMQFIPETWLRWAVDGSGDGSVDPQNIDDAAYTAANYLCRLDGSLETDDGWIAAVRSYNDTLDYQTRVATAATRYAEAG
ncbi:lytic transglycosylase domain-containing protein [Microbacterium indicum]|uniref:lytic transglycosylase domain-containing protein n=1 Tax=Microbacterium indicum TaxID=358100 RepID=UPI000A000277|nr:lytic murein transglycosylase [Microbacterium indicum]